MNCSYSNMKVALSLPKRMAPLVSLSWAVDNVIDVRTRDDFQVTDITVCDSRRRKRRDSKLEKCRKEFRSQEATNPTRDLQLPRPLREKQAYRPWVLWFPAGSCLEGSSNSINCKVMSNNASRIAGDDTSSRHIARHNGACSHNRALTDCNPWQDERTRTDESVAFNYYRRCLQCKVDLTEVVCARAQISFLCDRDAFVQDDWA
jgi:hypothetical protein